MEVDSGVAVIGAGLPAHLDDSWAGNKAAGFVNAADCCCESRSDTVLAALRVGRAPLARSPDEG